MAEDGSNAREIGSNAESPGAASQEFKVAVDVLRERIEELTGLLRTCQAAWPRGYDPVIRKFFQLTAVWKNDTIHLSNLTEKCSHPAYKEIIALGPVVLPLIFDELEREPDDWFLALRSLMGVDPVSLQAPRNLKQTVTAWLEWAKRHGYYRGPLAEEGLSEPQLEHVC